MQKKILKTLFYALSFLSIVFFASALRPVPEATMENCITVNGELESINEGISLDVVIDLKDDDRYFYVNRGMERGFDLSELKKSLGKKVEIKYVKHWTPLDPWGKACHVSFFEVDGEILYTELPISSSDD